MDHRPLYRRAAPRRGRAQGGRRHVVRAKSNPGRNAHHRRTPTGSVDDLRSSRRLRRVRHDRGRSRRARLPPGCVIGHRLRGHVQGGPAILRMPRPGQTRPVPQPTGYARLNGAPRQSNTGRWAFRRKEYLGGGSEAQPKQ